MDSWFLSWVNSSTYIYLQMGWFCVTSLGMYINLSAIVLSLWIPEIAHLECAYTDKQNYKELINKTAFNIKLYLSNKCISTYNPEKYLTKVMETLSICLLLGTKLCLNFRRYKLIESKTLEKMGTGFNLSTSNRLIDDKIIALIVVNKIPT